MPPASFYIWGWLLRCSPPGLPPESGGSSFPTWFDRRLTSAQLGNSSAASRACAHYGQRAKSVQVSPDLWDYVPRSGSHLASELASALGGAFLVALISGFGV